jgi:serine protease Do
MKHLSVRLSLAVVVGGMLAAHLSFASGGPLELPGERSPDFLLNSSQGYLGVGLREIDPDRISTLHLKDAHGAEITMVDHDAPAYKSGLHVHDVVLQLDGQPFDTAEQLRQRLRDFPPGRKIKLLVSRDGNSMTISAQLCDQSLLGAQAWLHHMTVPAPSALQAPMSHGFVEHLESTKRGILDTVIPRYMYVGAIVSPVMPQLAGYFGVRSGTGLLVESVDFQSPAGKAGLVAGDVVVKVDSNPMTRRSDWVKAIRSRRGQLVQVTVMRNKQEQVLAMSAGKLKKP